MCPEEAFLLSSFTWGAAPSPTQLHMPSTESPSSGHSSFRMFCIPSTSLHPSSCPPLAIQASPLMSTVLRRQDLCLQGCLLLAYSPGSQQARPLLSSAQLTPEVNLRHCYLIGSGVSSHTHMPRSQQPVFPLLQLLGTQLFSFLAGQSDWGNVVFVPNYFSHVYSSACHVAETP